MHVLFVRQSTFFIFKPVNYFHVDKNETGLNGKALQVHFTVSFLEYLYLYGTVHKIWQWDFEIRLSFFSVSYFHFIILFFLFLSFLSLSSLGVRGKRVG